MSNENQTDKHTAMKLRMSPGDEPTYTSIRPEHDFTNTKEPTHRPFTTEPFDFGRREVTLNPVLQDWVMRISMMQQTVLLSALRGPDGIVKYSPAKYIVRWLRRCVLYSAVDGKVMTNPYEQGGGSFTGPSYVPQYIATAEEKWPDVMNDLVSDYLRDADMMPHHFHLHLMHAAEIIGYHHPDQRIGSFWLETYHRFVNDMHLHPESAEELDKRLGDSESGWRERADPATIA